MNATPRTVNHLLIAMACAVIIVAGLRAATDLLGPILLAAFITAMVNPAVGWLRARRVPLWASVIGLLLVAVLLGALVILMVGLSLQELYRHLPEYGRQLEESLAGLNQWLEARNINVIATLKELPLEGRFLSTISEFVFGTLGVLTNLGFTLLLFAFMLISVPWFTEQLNRKASGQVLLAAIHEVNVRVVRVMRIRAALGLAAALGDVVLLWFLGVPFILLWGVLSFLLSFIPNIGFMLSLIPPALLALLQLGPTSAVLVVIGYIAINSFFDDIISPRLIGKGLGMAPATAMLGVVFWGWVLGPIGAVLSESLTLVLQRLVLNRFPDTQPLAQLISSDSGPESVG